MRGQAIAAVLLIGTAGCSESSDSLARAAQSGAEFRYYARHAYEALTIESCQERPALRRDLVLAREKAAMTALEERVRSHPAGAHLALARSDVHYAREVGGLGCWEDSSADFAAIHVQMARNRVRGGLIEMQRLASAAAPVPISGNIASSSAARFRSSARELIALLQPLCPSTPADNARILAPAKAELARFRKNLQETPYALHLAVAEADALYERSITTAECVDAPAVPPVQASRSALEETRRRIGSLATLARAEARR